MTRPFRRRHPPQFDGDLDTTQPITRLPGHRPGWDASTEPFTGTSATGLPPDTAPLERIRARSRQPEMFPALPDGDPRDTGPMQRMPRFTRVQQRPRPGRPYDAALFGWSGLLGQHIMLCGTCPPERRSRHADPTAAHMPFGFEALRVSAYAAGWRLDRFARWACPACQDTPAYHAPYPVTHYDAHAAQARLDGDPHAERGHRAAAEHDLILDVRRAATRYRHAPTAGTR